MQQDIADEIVRRVLPDAKDVATAPATVDADANDLLLLAQLNSPCYLLVLGTSVEVG